MFMPVLLPRLCETSSDLHRALLGLRLVQFPTRVFPSVSRDLHNRTRMSDLRVCVSVRSRVGRSLSQKSVDALNVQFAGHLYITRTSSDSHMWSAETIVQFFKFLRVVICSHLD